jgi:tetratricopeptide (TPR) repeat protein
MFFIIAIAHSDPLKKYKEALELFSSDQQTAYENMYSLTEELRGVEEQRNYYLVCQATLAKMLIDMGFYEKAIERELKFYKELEQEKESIMIFSTCWPGLLHTADNYFRAGHVKFALDALRHLSRNLDSLLNGKHRGLFMAMNPKGFEYLKNQLLHARSFTAFLHLFSGENELAREIFNQHDLSGSPLGVFGIYLLARLENDSEYSEEELSEMLNSSAKDGCPHAWLELAGSSAENFYFWQKIFELHRDSAVIDLRIGFMPPLPEKISALKNSFSIEPDAESLENIYKNAEVLWEEIAVVIKRNSTV